MSNQEIASLRSQWQEARVDFPRPHTAWERKADWLAFSAKTLAGKLDIQVVNIR